MATHAAFLRGINVGGRRATSDQLRRCLTNLGLREVATFRASGNVVFASADERVGEAELARLVEEAMLRALGFEVPVFLRTREEVHEIAARSPFDAAVGADAGKLQVLMLQKAPPAAARDEVLAMATVDDRLAIDGRELYWLPRARMRDSGLDLDAIARILGSSTMRTKGTIELIAQKFFAR